MIVLGTFPMGTLEKYLKMEGKKMIVLGTFLTKNASK